LSAKLMSQTFIFNRHIMVENNHHPHAAGTGIPVIASINSCAFKLIRARRFSMYNGGIASPGSGCFQSSAYKHADPNQILVGA
jgi:hypothetical protein